MRVGIKNVIHGLVDARARRGVVREERDGAAALDVGVGGENHTLADVLALHHRARGKVGDDADLLADQVFRREPLRDAGQDAALALAVKDGQVQQLLALLHPLAGADLSHAQLDLAEVVEGDFFLVLADQLSGSGVRLGGLFLLCGGVGSLSSGLLGSLKGLQLSQLLCGVNAGEDVLALMQGGVKMCIRDRA